MNGNWRKIVALSFALVIMLVALLGDRTWEKWMARVCKPFTLAKIRYFNAAEIDAARAWLAEA